MSRKKVLFLLQLIFLNKLFADLFGKMLFYPFINTKFTKSSVIKPQEEMVDCDCLV